MPSPLVQIRKRSVILAPQYCGSVSYYATMAKYGRAVIDTGLRYDKRFKSVHRCDIVDTRSQLQLTVPVSRQKDEPCRRWQQVTVSPQAQWWADHKISLESAYGRTPFFEYYIDRFLPLISSQSVGKPIIEIDRLIDHEIRNILQLDTDVSYADIESGTHAEADDFRKNDYPPMPAVGYYQVRAHKLGFVPGLSILDLIFNMGPESPLILYKMIQNQ